MTVTFTKAKEQVFQAAAQGELFAGCLIPGLSEAALAEIGTLETYSPYDGQVIGQIHAAGEAQVNAAVTAARSSLNPASGQLCRWAIARRFCSVGWC